VRTRYVPVLAVLVFGLAFALTTITYGGFVGYRAQLAALRDSAAASDRRADSLRATYDQRRVESDRALAASRQTTVRLGRTVTLLGDSVRRLANRGNSSPNVVTTDSSFPPSCEPLRVACLALADSADRLGLAVAAEQDRADSAIVARDRLVALHWQRSAELQLQRDSALALAGRGRPGRIVVGPYIGYDLVTGRGSIGVSLLWPVLRF
jgi:uncharacterized protein YfaS (alpha-2-macroglobulin family)